MIDPLTGLDEQEAQMSDVGKALKRLDRRVWEMEDTVAHLRGLFAVLAGEPYRKIYYGDKEESE